jgi:hypothetical protein
MAITHIVVKGRGHHVTDKSCNWEIHAVDHEGNGHVVECIQELRLHVAANGEARLELSVDAAEVEVAVAVPDTLVIGKVQVTAKIAETPPAAKDEQFVQAIINGRHRSIPARVFTYAELCELAGATAAWLPTITVALQGAPGRTVTQHEVLRVAHDMHGIVINVVRTGEA